MHFTCKLICVGIFALLLFSACSTKEKDSKNVTVLNIEEGLKNREEMFLSDIADSVSYIKLETTPECLIGNGTAFIRNDKVFVSTIKPARVLVFSTKGKYLYKLDNKVKALGSILTSFNSL